MIGRARPALNCVPGALLGTGAGGRSDHSARPVTTANSTIATTRAGTADLPGRPAPG